MSSPIDLTEDHKDHLPSDIQEGWLPTRDKSVLHLFTFDWYPVCKTHYLLPPDLTPVLHEADIPDFDYNILLQLGPPVDPSVSQAYQHAIRSTQHPVHSVTLTPSPGHGEPVRLPVWIFHYWREIELAASYLEQWRGAMVWLHSHSESPATAGCCQELLE